MDAFNGREAHKPFACSDNRKLQACQQQQRYIEDDRISPLMGFFLKKINFRDLRVCLKVQGLGQVFFCAEFLFGIRMIGNRQGNVDRVVPLLEPKSLSAANSLFLTTSSNH